VLFINSKPKVMPQADYLLVNTEYTTKVIVYKDNKKYLCDAITFIQQKPQLEINGWKFHKLQPQGVNKNINRGNFRSFRNLLKD